MEIPYENTTLPGYFYRVDDSGKPRPTLIVQTGFDGTQEELYVYAVAANQRGYNVLTFEGPGQGRVIRVQGLPFRPDWEKVITPVVDYTLSLPEVDPDKLALYGLSLGGYFTPRAAAYEPRIKALIANGGVYDPLETYSSESNTSREEYLDFVKENPEEYNKMNQKAMKNSTTIRWALEQGMYTFKAANPSEFIIKYSALTMNGSADKIQCPTLICDSESDDLMPRQAKELYEHLKCPKKYMLFTSNEGAGEHCQMGAISLSNQRILDWLDEIFN